MDGNINQKQYKSYNDKWQAEKDKLYIQLDEINKPDNRFYNQSDSLLDFTENAYQYYLKGNALQKRRIIEIIKDKITYKDKKLNIELKPIFQTIVENQYILSQKLTRIELAESGIIKGIETNLTPKYTKKLAAVGLEAID